jgi:hypothetical protein
MVELDQSNFEGRFVLPEKHEQISAIEKVDFERYVRTYNLN